MNNNYPRYTDKMARAYYLNQDLSTEVYHALNMRNTLTQASEEELSVLRRIVDRAKKLRTYTK